VRSTQYLPVGPIQRYTLMEIKSRETIRPLIMHYEKHQSMANSILKILQKIYDTSYTSVGLKSECAAHMVTDVAFQSC